MPPTATKQKRKPEPNSKKRFKVVAGSHSHMGWVPATKEEVMNGLPGLVKRPDDNYYKLQVTTYERGDDFESEKDLDKRFNIQGHHQPHLMKVGANGQPFGTSPNPWDFLETKTVEQLRALAVYEEIDLGNADTKEQVLKVMTDYRDGVEEEVTVPSPKKNKG